MFSFTAGNAVDCFGMDNFYINEPPPSVPNPPRSCSSPLASSLEWGVGAEEARQLIGSHTRNTLRASGTSSALVVFLEPQGAGSLSLPANPFP